MVEGGEGALDQWPDEGVVGAAEDEGCHSGCGCQSFGEVDAHDFGGDGMGDPTFFDQRDEERAGFFVGGEADGGAGSGVGAGLDGGDGGEDEEGWSLVV